MDRMLNFVVFCVMWITVVPECNSDFVEMKIVEEPSTLGFQQSFAFGNFPVEETLTLRIQPANFSGPLHFKRLIGRCFHSVINDYKYSFCPFSNVTQHEQQVHWNPYKGVLGVWQEWEVKNNIFTSMMMKDGDACGEDLYRSVRVIFLCGNHSKVMNATEPQRCSYELLFMTPLVCAKDAMLVYPSLNKTLQHEWDLLEGDMVTGALTEKGYKRRLHIIFEKAGIYLSKENRKVLTKTQEEKSSNVEGGFDNLMTCNSAYQTLKQENEALKHQMEAIRNTLGGNMSHNVRGV